MPDTMYDNQEKDPLLDKIKSQEGLPPTHHSTGASSSSSPSQANNLYYNGLGEKSFTSDQLKAAESSGTSAHQFEDQKQNLYTPSPSGKAGGLSNQVKSSGKMWLILGGSTGALLLVFILVFLYLSSLAIPNLAQNILAYQFARASKSFSENDLELTSEKLAVDSLPNTAADDTVASTFSDSTSGLWARMQNWSPSAVVDKMEASGTLSYTYEPSRFLQKPILKSITIGDETFAVNNDNLVSKFQTLRHPIQTFQDQVDMSTRLSGALDSVMRDNTPTIIRGAIEGDIRSDLNISLSPWVVSKFVGDTPTQAANEADTQAQNIIDPSSQPPIPSSDDSVAAAEKDGETALEEQESTPAGLEAIRAAGGAAPKADALISGDLANILNGFVSKVSPLYAIAVPVCIIYDGSLSSPNASAQINSQDAELQRSFYLVESTADEQKAGAINAELLGAVYAKVGNTGQSNAIMRASGESVDTDSSFVSPQAGAGGQYSIGNLLPWPLSSLAIKLGGPLCPKLTNIKTAAALAVLNVLIEAATAIPTGGTGTVVEEGGEAGAEAAINTGLSGLADNIAGKLSGNVLSSAVLRESGKLSEMFTVKELTKVSAITGLAILAKMDVLAKMNETYNGLSQGTDFANQADAGGNLNANQVEQQEFYGAPLSNTQIAYNDSSDQQYIADQNASQGAFQRYLAVDNASSLVSKLSDSIMGSVNKSIFSGVFSDIGKLLDPLSLGTKLFGAFDHSAMAAAAASNPVDNNDYGIVQWGYTSQESALMSPTTGDPSYQPLENSQILFNSGKESYIEAVYGPCFSEYMGTLLTQTPPATVDNYSVPDHSQPYITRDTTGNVIGGLCSETYLGPDSADPNVADGKYGNDLIFRWRLAQSYNQTLDQLTDIQNVGS